MYAFWAFIHRFELPTRGLRLCLPRACRRSALPLRASTQDA